MDALNPVQIRYGSTNFFHFPIDNAYFQVYNRIKSSKGELTMFRYCFNVVDNKSGNPMRWLGLGLTLSYSF